MKINAKKNIEITAMFYKLLNSLFIIIIISSTALSLELNRCSNKTEKIKTVCRLIDNYEIDEPSTPFPITIELDINILDIVDLDWTANTITLFIQLWTFWKDSRLTINDYIDTDETKEKGLVLCVTNLIDLISIVLIAM